MKISEFLHFRRGMRNRKWRAGLTIWGCGFIRRHGRTAQGTYRRYVNAGTADTFIVSGTTLTDLPATPEIRIKFDGANRWRAYNAPADGGGLLNGISAQQTRSSAGVLSFFAETNSSIYQGENVTKTNQLQTVLLHMISGSSASVIEAWVDGSLIHMPGNIVVPAALTALKTS